MSRLGFIQVHKRNTQRSTAEAAAKATLVNVTAIRSVAKYDDHAVIEVSASDTFSVAESYEQVIAMLQQAGGRITSSEPKGFEAIHRYTSEAANASR